MALASEMERGYPLTVVCVGTDRSTGDSLGPLVGTMLSWAGFRGTVLGDLDNPVHAENLDDAAAKLDGGDGLVIGVDACLGARQEVGAVMVRAGPLRPGLGVKKKLPPVGDLHIAAVVNVGGFMEYMVLQNTRLSLVVKMAQVIAAGIAGAEDLMGHLCPREDRDLAALADAATPAVPETGAPRLPLALEFARRR